MQRHYHRPPRGPFPRRPGLPFGRGDLLNDLLVGGLGYLIGRQQGQSQSGPRQPADTTHSDQLAQLRLLEQLRASGVLTEQAYQEQKQKILRPS